MWLICLGLLFVLPAFGQVKQSTLGNGFKIIVKEIPGTGIVGVGLNVKASPLYETPEQRGMSELLQVMLVEQPRTDGSLSDQLEDMGVKFDYYTSPDTTLYRMTVATPVFSDALGLMMKAIANPQFDETAWQRKTGEMSRRLQESRTLPLSVADRALWQAAFAQHPYGRQDLLPEKLAEVTPGQLVDFHKLAYGASAMTLVVIGDIKPARVFELAKTHCDSLPAGGVLTPTVTPEPVIKTPRTRLNKGSTRGTIINYAWHAPGMDKKKDVCAIDVLYALLDEGVTARLVKTFLHEDNEIQALPTIQFITRRDAGLFIFQCICSAENERAVRQLMLDEIARLRDEPIKPDELDEAKALIKAGYAFDNETVDGEIGSMAFYEAIDSYQFALDYPELVDRVTIDDIQRVARTYLRPETYVLSIVRPRGEGADVLEAHLIP